MAIIGSAEVEVRAEVRKLGKDIKDSFSGLTSQAEKIGDDLGKSIKNSMDKYLSDIKISARMDDKIIDDIAYIRSEIEALSDETIKVNVDTDNVNIPTKGQKVEVDVVANVDDSIFDIPEKVQTELDIDDSSLISVREKLIDIYSSIEAIATEYTIDFSVDDDIDEAIAKLEELRKQMEDDIELGVSVSQADIEKVHGSIESLRAFQEANDIELGIDVHITKALAKLETLARDRYVEIIPRVNMAAVGLAQGMLAGFSGYNLMKEEVKDFIEEITELDKKLPQLAKNLAMLSVAVPSVGFGAGALTMLIGDLAALSGLIVPATSLLLGFGGAMAIISIAMQDVSKRFPEVTKQFGELKKSIQGDFWSQAEAPLNRLAFTGLPAIVNAMKPMTKATGHMVGALMDAVTATITSNDGLSAFKLLILNTSTAMKNMSKGFRPLISGILHLGAIGSAYLPRLGAWFEEIAISFEKWVKANDKQILDWVESGITSLKELGSLVVETVKIFYQLYQIGKKIGFPGLTELVGGFKRINEVLADDRVSTTLTSIGVSVKSAFTNIVSGLSWVGPAIMNNTSGIVKMFEDMGYIGMKVFEGIGNAITKTGLDQAFFNLFGSMRRAIDDFMPAFEYIGTIIAVTLDFLGTAMESIAPTAEQFFHNLKEDAVLVKPAFEGMIELIGSMTEPIMEVVGVITNGLAAAFGALPPAVALAGVGFVALIGPLTTVGLFIGGAAKAFLDFGETVTRVSAAFSAGGFSSIPAVISNAFRPIGSIIDVLFTQPFNAIKTVVGGIVKDLDVPIQTVISSFDDLKVRGSVSISMLKDAILRALSPISNLFTTLGTSIGQFASRLGGALGQVGSKIMSVLPFTDQLGAMLGKLGSGGFMTAVRSALKMVPVVGIIIDLFIGALFASEDLRNAVGTFLGNAFKTLLAFIQPIIKPLGNLFMTLMNGLADLGAKAAPAFTGLFNALNSIMPVVQLVAHFIGSVLGGAINGIATILKTAFTVVGNILGGVANVIGGAFNIISSVITGIINVIKGLVSGDMAAVKEAFAGMWEGIKSGAGQAFEGLLQTVGGVLAGIPQLIMGALAGILEVIKAPLENFNLLEQGNNIIQSLIDGFTGAIDKVQQWLQDLTQKIIEWKGPPDNDATLLNDAGNSIIMSLVDGFKQAVQSVFEFLQGLTQQIVDIVMGIINGVVTVFQTGWSMLTTIVSTVWNGIITVIQLAWAGIQAAIQIGATFVTTIFQTIWTGLTTIVSTVWAGITAVIQIAWTTIQNVIQIGLTAVTAIFQVVWGGLTTIVSAIWNGITAIISSVLSGIMGVVNAILPGVITVVSTVWNTVKGVTSTVWNTIKTLLGLGLAAIKALVTGNFDAFKRIISAAWSVIQGTTSRVWNIIKSGITTVVNAIRSTITNVFNAIKNAISNVLNTIRSTVSNVFNTIRSTISTVVNTIRSVVSAAFNAVRSVISGTLNAARSVVSSVFNTIRSVISSVSNTVRSTISSAFNALKSIISNAMSSAAGAVRNGASRVLGIIRGIPGQIRSAMGNAGNILVSAGRNIINGLINGISGMIGSLKSKFSSITNMIPNWKGPPDTDAKLLVNAGELIMEGLIDGLESKYGKVRSSLQSFTGSLSQTVGTQIGADVGVATQVQATATDDAQQRLAYRSAINSVLQSNNTQQGSDREVHLHFHDTGLSQSEVIMIVNRELGRGV